MHHRLAMLAIVALGIAFALPASAADLAPAAEAALQRILEGGRDSRSDAVLVLRDGAELGHYYPDDEAPAPIELMSATKSVVALGIGQLIGQGRISSLDQPVADFYPEWRQGRKRDITIRMLLNHTSGLQNVPAAPAEIYPAPDVVQLALAAELDSAPGEKFSYNNKATNLLAGIIAKASGQPMDAFFRDGLFADLGIEPGDWQKDKAGNPHAMSGLPLSAADAARIGQLVLDGGAADGRQLVPAGFIEAMLAPGQALSPECGLLWWRRAAWVRYASDPASFAMMRGRGVPEDVVVRLEALLDGKQFDSRAAMIAGLLGPLGDDWGSVREALGNGGVGVGDLFAVESGPVVAYAAEGYLGQYIVMVPAAGLVAVRQIAAGDDAEPPLAEGYPDFTQRVVELAAAMGGLPAASVAVAP